MQFNVGKGTNKVGIVQERIWNGAGAEVERVNVKNV